MLVPDVSFGNGCDMQTNIVDYKSVILKDDLFGGPSMVLTKVLTPRANIDRPPEFLDTWVGRGPTCSAGAVVARDVLAQALVVGTRARQIGWVSEASEWLSEVLTCPRNGSRYDMRGGKQVQAG